MTTLGFVVLAKRPLPDCSTCERGDEECPEHGEAPYPRRTRYSYEPVSAVFPEPPENALEYCQKRQERDDIDAELYPLDPPAERVPVEYVIGAVTLADLAKPEWRVK